MAKSRSGKKKVRADFRKNRGARTRDADLTREYRQAEEVEDLTDRHERVSGKGELTRKRTIVAAEDTEADEVVLAVDESACLRGRVLSVHGLASNVESEDGTVYRCATRRLLKTLSTEQRNVVATGDRVLFRPSGSDEGIIERVEPRRGYLSRASRGRKHVIVANVDQLLIITCAAEPSLKPNLIDRFLVTAEKAGIRAVICVNKIDLVSPADLQPLLGVFGQMGYETLLVSAATGFNVNRLKQIVQGKQNVVAGQSGVGKSSLLNAIQPGLDLEVRSVSEETEKGRHTTTAARLIPLNAGGWIVDTPGIRQFQLWDVIPEEVAGFFRDLRPYVAACRFPDCSHTHESDCAVKHAVADGRLDARRYESYCQMLEPDSGYVMR